MFLRPAWIILTSTRIRSNSKSYRMTLRYLILPIRRSKKKPIVRFILARLLQGLVTRLLADRLETARIVLGQITRVLLKRHRLRRLVLQFVERTPRLPYIWNGLRLEPLQVTTLSTLPSESISMVRIKHLLRLVLSLPTTS